MPHVPCVMLCIACDAMSLQICSPLPDYSNIIFFKALDFHVLPPLTTSNLNQNQNPPSFPSHDPQKLTQCSKQKTFPPHHNLTKRQLNISFLALLLNGSSRNVSMASGFELERYTDSKEGFTLLRPSSWIKVDKAGATVLFEEPNKGSNNVGVVVNPVRLTALREFGSPEFVADKLIQAEKRKESTKEAEVISARERPGQGGLQVYEFEYKVDSTRGGMKRIFSAVFVASRKLYLLNIAHSDKQESPLDARTRAMLEEVLHSFDAAPTA